LDKLGLVSRRVDTFVDAYQLHPIDVLVLSEKDSQAPVPPVERDEARRVSTESGVRALDVSQ
jgi:hypothetical protein